MSAKKSKKSINQKIRKGSGVNEWAKGCFDKTKNVKNLAKQSKQKLADDLDDKIRLCAALTESKDSLDKRCEEFSCVLQKTKGQLSEVAHAANMWKSAYYTLIEETNKMRDQANAMREVMHNELVPTVDPSKDPDSYKREVHKIVDAACQKLADIEGKISDFLADALSGKSDQFVKACSATTPRTEADMLTDAESMQSMESYVRKIKHEV